jgi:ferric-dicitrate binding protein FerR (iron transport regulator)
LSAITTPAPAVVQLLKNGTQQKETILLPDSSTVVLYPGSIISYAKGFDPAHRNIHLQGEACFTVAKDARRPFTVYANGIATTALGTRFTVSTFYSNERVRVRLIEGKVVVRSQEQALAMQPVYLQPGQECMVNKGSGEALVKAFTLNSATVKRNSSAGNNTIQKNNTAALEFSREPLVNVLARIEKLYHVTIAYPGVTMGRLSFTGTFLPSDSLPVVLSIICKTNDLAFEQKDSLITITLLP